MSKKQRRLFSFLSLWAPFFGYAGLIFYFSSLPGLELPRLLFDPKQILYHVAEYSVFGALLARALRSRPAFLHESAIAGLLYGISDEVHQYFVPGRFSDPFDVLADGIGSLLGAYLYRSFAARSVKGQ